MQTKEVFLELVRLGIETGSVSSFWFQDSSPIDWEAIEAIAVEQGLSAVVVDGVDRLPIEIHPPKLVLLQWIGETLQSYENRYDQYRKAISELAGFYNAHGFKMMVLKGYACALDWPKPEHRPCGDIDIWQFGEQKASDMALAGNTNIQIDGSHHHHTVFYWKGFMVENHYDFVNTVDMKLSKEIEKLFKELGDLKVESLEFRAESQLKDCSDAGCRCPVVEVYDERVYLPSPNLHALFLLRHMIAHFASTFVSVRQILDWAFFVKAHTAEIDWKWLLNVIEKYRMTVFFNCINAICVEDLGFRGEMFPYIQFEPIKERILNDVLNPKFTEEEPEGFINKYMYKFKRWQGNAWKQRMCYPESRLSIFVWGLWAHIVTPKHYGDRRTT